MLKIMRISTSDILQHLKLACQIPDIASAIATRRVIMDATRKANIQIEPAELQQAADSLRLVNNLMKAEDTWAWLQKHHLSLDELEELAQINLLTAKLAHHLFADQIEPFLFEHLIDYTGAVTYEVVLDDEDLALELFYALQEGEISFQEVVRQYIQDPDVRRAGGYRGIQRRTGFRPEITAAVFAAKPPQVLKPIITPKGAHLIQVEEIIQPQLDEPLRIKILADLFSTWLNQQVDQVEVRVQLEPKALVEQTTQPELVPNGNVHANVGP